MKYIKLFQFCFNFMYLIFADADSLNVNKQDLDQVMRVISIVEVHWDGVESPPIGKVDTIEDVGLDVYENFIRCL